MTSKEETLPHAIGKCSTVEVCVRKNTTSNGVQKLWHSIISLHGSPHDIAFGAAIGLFVAFTPTMGIQMIIAAAIATACGANRVSAIIPVWITNPLTAVPIYGFCYWLGSFLWEGPPVSEVFQQLTAVIMGLQQYRFYHIVEIFKEFLRLGANVIIPMTIGGFLSGLLAGAIIYPITLRGIGKYREIKEQLKEAQH